MNKNDERNEKLLKVIEETEQALVKPEVNLRTNCTLEIFGCKKNLHVCNTDDLILLKVQINMLIMSANDMEIHPLDVKISGFSLSDWMADIDAKIEMAKYKKKKSDLDKMKKKLNDLLSEDRRNEIQLDIIESTLRSDFSALIP